MAKTFKQYSLIFKRMGYLLERFNGSYRFIKESDYEKGIMNYQNIENLSVTLKELRAIEN